MLDFGVPLGAYKCVKDFQMAALLYLRLDVVKGWWAHDGEADKKDVGLGIRERS